MYNLKFNILYIFFPLIVLIPFSSQLYFGTSSPALGLLLVAVIIIIICFLRKDKIKITSNALLLTFFIFMYILVIGMFYYFKNESFNHKKFLLSIIILIFLFLSANIVASYMKRIPEGALERIINFIFYLLLIDGLFTTLCYILKSHNKLFFLTSEASHFALLYLPFLCFKTIAEKRIFKVATWLILSLFISLFIGSLTLLVGLLLISLVKSIKYSFYFLTVIAFIVVITVACDFNFINIDYFVDRLDFINTQNVSVLVFLSGWERAFLNFKDTYGLGIGFQQLGFLGNLGVYQQRLEMLNMGNLNLQDGGTTASKLISELGILGLLLFLFYLYMFLKTFIKIKNIDKYNLSKKDLFFYSILLMIFIEMVIRGIGYFSPTMFLFYMSIFYFLNYKYSYT